MMVTREHEHGLCGTREERCADRPVCMRLSATGRGCMHVPFKEVVLERVVVERERADEGGLRDHLVH